MKVRRESNKSLMFVFSLSDMGKWFLHRFLWEGQSGWIEAGVLFSNQEDGSQPDRDQV